jgi:thiamine monophosphate synthase
MPFYSETKQFPQNSKLTLSLYQWQRLTEQDTSSKAITAATEWARARTASLLVNDTDKAVQVPADGLDLDGKPLSGTLRLEPFESRVIFR